MSYSNNHTTGAGPNSKGSNAPVMRQNNPYQPIPTSGSSSPGPRSPHQPLSPVGVLQSGPQGGSAYHTNGPQQPVAYQPPDRYLRSPPQPVAPPALGVDRDVVGAGNLNGGIATQLPRYLPTGLPGVPPRQPNQPPMQQQKTQYQQSPQHSYEEYSNANPTQGYPQPNYQQPQHLVGRYPSDSHPGQHQVPMGHQAPSGAQFNQNTRDFSGGQQQGYISQPSTPSVTYNNMPPPSSNSHPPQPTHQSRNPQGSIPTSPHQPHPQYNGHQSPMYATGGNSTPAAANYGAASHNVNWSQPNTPSQPLGGLRTPSTAHATPNTAGAHTAPLNFQNLFLPKLPDQLRQDDVLVVLTEGVKLAAPMQLAPSLGDSSMPMAHNGGGYHHEEAAIEESTSRPLSPFTANQGGLTHLLPQPPLSAIVSLDPISGASKRFGFALFPSADAGHKTMQLLNGCEVVYGLSQKRVFSIKTPYELEAKNEVSKPSGARLSASQSPHQAMPSGSPSGSLPFSSGVPPNDTVVFRLIITGSKFDGTQAAAPSACLYVRNIPVATSAEEINNLLSMYGRVEYTNLRHDHLQRPIWVVFVEYDSVESAQRALTALHGNRALFPDAPAPVLAKFADTQEHREQRRALRSEHPRHPSASNTNRHSSNNHPNTSHTDRLGSTPSTPQSMFVGGAHANHQQSNPHHHLSAQMLHQHAASGYQQSPPTQVRQQQPTGIVHNPYTPH